MITIPFSLFSAISIVLAVGFIWDFGKYIRIISIILYLGFWFSFKAGNTPHFVESIYSNAISAFDALL